MTMISGRRITRRALRVAAQHLLRLLASRLWPAAWVVLKKPWLLRMNLSKPLRFSSSFSRACRYSAHRASHRQVLSSTKIRQTRSQTEPSWPRARLSESFNWGRLRHQGQLASLQSSTASLQKLYVTSGRGGRGFRRPGLTGTISRRTDLCVHPSLGDLQEDIRWVSLGHKELLDLNVIPMPKYQCQYEYKNLTISRPNGHFKD